MADIIHFVPRDELDADSNLMNFIEGARDKLTVFGTDLAFDENEWDVTDAIARKRTDRTRFVFSNWSSANDRIPLPLREPFLSFAKAYMRYQHAFRPTKCYGQRLAALRALEAALTENGERPNPTLATLHTFNRAYQLCVDKFTNAVAYRVGGQLEMLNEFLITHRLLAVPARWHSPAQRPSDTARVGAEFDKRRAEKLPSPTALSALANIFHLAKEPFDVLLSSIVAILCSAPDRVSEVLYLEADCEVSQVIPSSGEAVYGLRWRPAKGADPMVKWIIPSMSDVVRQAISNIRKLTEPARVVAKWYEMHPAALYLPPHFEHLRSFDRLSLKIVSQILFAGTSNPQSSWVWCRQNGVPILGVKRGEATCKFADLERAVIANLPDGFPWADRAQTLKYSEALCVTQRNMMQERKARFWGLIDLLNHGHIADGLGARSKYGIRSLFDRFEFTEDDGSPIRLRSHQFRHYLNTLAQAGGLSQLDIAKWSGRKDVRQNGDYDHQSDRDVVARVRSMMGDSTKARGYIATVPLSTLVHRDEFARLKIPTAHTTEFGFCIHDYSMLPCQLHRDCLNCNEQVCIKGDVTREANIRRHRAETQQLLEDALAANRDQYAGANRWVAHQQATLTRLNELCAILDDPNVPAGAVIQPSKVVPASRIEQAADARPAAVAALTGGSKPHLLPPPTDCANVPKEELET
jgi:hypothetical protein